MANGEWNVSPEELDGLAKQLEAYQRAVLQAGKTMEGAVRGLKWNDPQKNKFENHFREHVKSTNRFVNDETGQMIKYLKGTASTLRDLQRRHP